MASLAFAGLRHTVCVACSQAASTHAPTRRSSTLLAHPHSARSFAHHHSTATVSALQSATTRYCSFESVRRVFLASHTTSSSMPPKKRASQSGASESRKVSDTTFRNTKAVANEVQKRKTIANTEVKARESQFEHKRTQNDKPCNDALGTTEILEGILECLSPAKLHLIQRVNKRFQDVIVRSPRIQRRMFRRIDNKPGFSGCSFRLPEDIMPSLLGP